MCSERERFSCCGVGECDGVGVEVEPYVGRHFCPDVSAASVQEVSEDRSAEAERVGRVDTELVGAAGVRMKQDVGASVFARRYGFIFCQGGFALRSVDFLAGSFVVVGA